MSFTNAKFLLIVLLLSLIHATFAKKALLRKSLAASSAPINDFSAFWDLTKKWSAIFTESRSLAGQIRSDLAVNGTTPVEVLDKEMTTLFKQNPPFRYERVINYWIINNNYNENSVNLKQAQIDVQNGLLVLSFFRTINETYVVGTSEYAEKVNELVAKLDETNRNCLKLSKEYFKLADNDNTEDVSHVEFEAAFGPIIPSGVDVEKLFNEFDFNQSRTLSQDEIGEVVAKILSLNVPEFYKI